MPPFDFSEQPLLFNVAIFAAAAFVLWRVGAKLTTYTDLIAVRTGLGHAFAGVLLLGGATSLPEIATTVTASATGNAVLAGTNLLGGVTAQVAVLAAADALMLRGRALTLFSPQPALLMQGVVFILLAAVAIAAIAVGEFAVVGGIGGWSVLLMGFYLVSLFTIRRYEKQPRWEPKGEVAATPKFATDLKDAREEKYAHASTSRIGLYFGLSALIVLGSGFIIARTADVLAVQTGLGSGFVGATFLAIATSLPEVSTTFAAVRFGAYSLAIANILGTNALEVALFFVADVFYREGPVLEEMGDPGIFLAALGISVTCVYLWGLLERRDKTVLGMGVDSVLVLVLYTAGMAAYYLMS